jgi:hypothetical protein
MQFRRDVWAEYKSPLGLWLAGAGYEYWCRSRDLARAAEWMALALEWIGKKRRPGQSGLDALREFSAEAVEAVRGKCD